MMPRIKIPWYRLTIKQSIFDDTNTPRGFNFDIDLPKPKTIDPLLVPATIPELALAPSTEPALFPSLVPGLEPSLVPGLEPGLEPGTVPGLEPGTVPSPVPGTVPNPVPGTVPSPVPGTVPLPKPINIPSPKPILPPIPVPEKNRNPEPTAKPIPTIAEMMEAQKEAQRQIINNKAYKEMVQIDMLMERNLAMRRNIDNRVELTASNLMQYDNYIQKQTINISNAKYQNITITKETRDRQIKAFDESIKNIEKSLGKSKDIVLDYIKKNEITFATLPHHYKEINKEIAKAGIQGLVIGGIAYILYQIAKVSIIAL